jgi:hypothetical protein
LEKIHLPRHDASGVDHAIFHEILLEEIGARKHLELSTQRQAQLVDREAHSELLWMDAKFVTRGTDPLKARGDASKDGGEGRALGAMISMRQSQKHNTLNALDASSERQTQVSVAGPCENKTKFSKVSALAYSIKKITVEMTLENLDLLALQPEGPSQHISPTCSRLRRAPCRATP